MQLQQFVFLIFPFIVCINALYAAELDYSLELEMGSYTNILQVEDPVSDEVSESIRWRVMLNENTADLMASVNLMAQVTNYKNNIEDDSNQADLNAIALWVLSPNHYEWYFQNIFTHTAINLLSTDIASNRQYVNALATGPNFIWRFGKANSLRIEPRIEDYRYENEALSNKRFNTAFEWTHTPSKKVTYSLLSRYETTNYTSSSIDESDFDQFDLSALLTYTDNKNTLIAESGITQVESSSFGDESDTQYRFSINNQRTSTSSLFIEASKYVTDTSRSITSAAAINSDLFATTNDLFTSETMLLNYTRGFSNSELIMGLSQSSDDYFLQNALDRDIDYAFIDARWINARNSVFRLQYSVRESQYTVLLDDRLDTDVLGLLSYSYRTNSNINYSISFTSIERESSAATENFDDKRILFSIEYTTRNRNS